MGDTPGRSRRRAASESKLALDAEILRTPDRPLTHRAEPPSLRGSSRTAYGGGSPVDRLSPYPGSQGTTPSTTPFMQRTGSGYLLPDPSGQASGISSPWHDPPQPAGLGDGRAHSRGNRRGRGSSTERVASQLLQQTRSEWHDLESASPSGAVSLKGHNDRGRREDRCREFARHLPPLQAPPHRTPTSTRTAERRKGARRSSAGGTPGGLRRIDLFLLLVLFAAVFFCVSTFRLEPVLLGASSSEDQDRKLDALTGRARDEGQDWKQLLEKTAKLESELAARKHRSGGEGGQAGASEGLPGGDGVDSLPAASGGEKAMSTEEALKWLQTLGDAEDGEAGTVGGDDLAVGAAASDIILTPNNTLVEVTHSHPAVHQAHAEDVAVMTAAASSLFTVHQAAADAAPLLETPAPGPQPASSGGVDEAGGQPAASGGELAAEVGGNGGIDADTIAADAAAGVVAGLAAVGGGEDTLPPLSAQEAPLEGEVGAEAAGAAVMAAAGEAAGGVAGTGAATVAAREELDPRVYPQPYQFDLQGTRLSFRMSEVLGADTHETVDTCADVMPMPTQLPDSQLVPFLFVLGVQKGGTNFLFHALIEHPNFVYPTKQFHAVRDRKYRKNERVWDEKEVHYFDRWPLGPMSMKEYLDCWQVNPRRHTGKALVFHESTPDYFYLPSAPIRLRHLLPQSKFVLVFRDPVMRALSHWRMQNRLCHEGFSGTVDCPPPFSAAISEEIKLLRSSGCGFSTKKDPSQDWNDCFKCYLIWRQGCEEHPEDEGDSACHPRLGPRGPMTNGLYAAQLGWWLRFFPPERFMILGKDDLFTPDAQFGIVNDVVRFAGVEDTFQDPAMLESLFSLKSDGIQWNQFSEADFETINTMRDFYRKPQQDLYALLHLLDVTITPLKDEVCESVVNYEEDLPFRGITYQAWCMNNVLDNVFSGTGTQAGTQGNVTGTQPA